MRFSPTIFAFFISSLLILPSNSKAGDGKMTREEYISRYKNDAVRDMKKTGVPASITLAQALLESNDGNSPLATEANNHFGVKCADWNGPTYTQDDDHKDECFRKYSSALESYDDHSNFLRTRPRYASLFTMDVTDYKGWARGLKSAGYATNPAYADRLIKIIEDNGLDALDKGQDIQPSVYALNKGKSGNTEVASTYSKPATHKPSFKLSTPGTDVVNPYGTHEILVNNDVPYIVTKPNDSYRRIADEFQLGLWQVYKYNDLDRNAPIAEGQKIYLKPKKRNGASTYYVVKSGQTLHDVAQEQGIKMRLLKKWNHLDDNAQAQVGQKLLLKKS